MCWRSFYSLCKLKRHCGIGSRHVCTTLAVPALAYAVCTWYGLPSLQTQILVIFFALPTASASYILTKVLGGDSQLMAAVISFQTLCAAVTLPLVIWWLS